MKNVLIISCLLLFNFCNSSSTKNKKQETPKALEKDGNSYITISKRGYIDLVESLYDEEVEKYKELQQLESMISNLNDSFSDSTKPFKNFNQKNNSFYNTANNHLENIKDSILKNKMKVLIKNSLTRYNSKIKEHENILQSIDKKHVSLNDLHEILKLNTSLAIIEKYQTNNFPSKKPINNYLKNLNYTVSYEDSLLKNIYSK